MPNMADITVVNKAAANVVYVKAAPASGDKTLASWQQTAASAVFGLRPRFTVSFRNSGTSGNARRMDAQLTFPVVETVGGVANTRTGTAVISCDAVFPTNCDATQVSDAFVQFGNLMISALVRAAADELYSPT